jgi:hypothetical protein
MTATEQLESSAKQMMCQRTAQADRAGNRFANSCRPTGLNSFVLLLNPGLTSWATCVSQAHISSRKAGFNELPESRSDGMCEGQGGVVPRLAGETKPWLNRFHKFGESREGRYELDIDDSNYQST